MKGRPPPLDPQCPRVLDIWQRIIILSVDLLPRELQTSVNWLSVGHYFRRGKSWARTSELNLYLLDKTFLFIYLKSLLFYWFVGLLFYLSTLTHKSALGVKCKVGLGLE